MPQATTAVFDFDHTLTRWDTAARFFGWLLRRAPWKVLLGAPLALLLGPLALFSRTRRIPVRYLAWLATFGFGHEQLRVLARLHVAETIEGGESFVRHDARRQIELHGSQGHIVVVATGALEYLAGEILAQAGIVNVAVVGSSMRRFLGGMVVNQHCYGARKVPMLQSRGFDPPWAFVYSDHEADLPLLKEGTTQVIVNPKPAAAHYLLSVLGPSASVVTWR
ncbi:MAG TPA: haloacid dehalogenase-like hydrolase [Steroidobacteraceae bacterium]|jgi:phosphatidylglycerophosphatase C|nr:haloacid dehalogenase-like hydrolase [Steroidobacteraceae bacterium]